MQQLCFTSVKVVMGVHLLLSCFSSVVVVTCDGCAIACAIFHQLVIIMK